MIFKRNRIIVTALVAMIAVAGYLNFTESRSGISGDETALILTDDGDIEASVMAEDAIATLPDDMEVELDPITADVLSEDTDTGAAVFVSAESADTYFVQAKLEREQSRAKQTDILNEMINNENVDSGQKAECADEILKLRERIEKESSAEAMIESKGFSEAYVRIDDETVDVVVNKSELTEAELAQIEDIVKRKTGYNEEQIRISPLQPAES
ncbi:MAG: SpoIIIAH-like family protein [Firmicutes bacterium]|nr:SpoIIIAH-like family protein [Bacillota bacterium]